MTDCLSQQEQRYSELTGRDQNEYVISVLAPHAIVFLSLKLDEDFRGNVEAKMPKDADKMSPEEQDQRRHDLALEEIDRQTLIKWYQTLISTVSLASDCSALYQCADQWSDAAHSARWLRALNTQGAEAASWRRSSSLLAILTSILPAFLQSLP